MIRLLKPCSAADQQGVSGLWAPPAPSELPTIWIRGTAPSAGQIRHSRLYLQNICFSYLTAENLRKIKMALAGELFLKSPQTQLHTFVMIWGAKCNKPGGNTNPASMYQKIHPVPSLDKCESCTRNRLGQQEHGLGAVYNMHHPHEGRKTQQHCIHSQDLVTAEGRERWGNISVQKQITSDCYCERKAADSEQARWTQMWSLYGNNGQRVPAFSDHRMLLTSCGQILKNMVRRSTVWMASNQGMNQTRPAERQKGEKTPFLLVVLLCMVTHKCENLKRPKEKHWGSVQYK